MNLEIAFKIVDDEIESTQSEMVEAFRTIEKAGEIEFLSDRARENANWLYNAGHLPTDEERAQAERENSI